MADRDKAREGLPLIVDATERTTQTCQIEAEYSFRAAMIFMRTAKSGEFPDKEELKRIDEAAHILAYTPVANGCVEDKQKVDYAKRVLDSVLG
jgi:hypothetical protein